MCQRNTSLPRNSRSNCGEERGFSSLVVLDLTYHQPEFHNKNNNNHESTLFSRKFEPSLSYSSEHLARRRRPEFSSTRLFSEPSSHNFFDHWKTSATQGRFPGGNLELIPSAFPRIRPDRTKSTIRFTSMHSGESPEKKTASSTNGTPEYYSIRSSVLKDPPSLVNSRCPNSAGFGRGLPIWRAQT